MKKILIVSHSGFRDSLIPIKECLEKYGYEVDTYPLFKYALETLNKSKNYQNDFLDYIGDNSPDILLWCFIDVPVDVIKYISVNTNLFSILLCWNDPVIWSDKSSDIKSKCPYFDLVLSMCKETKTLFVDNGVTDSISCYPGYDPSVNFPMFNTEYECDVSFCCTDLYEDQTLYGDQLIYRKDLIDRLCTMENIIFHLYGPPYLFLRYPKHYKGFIEYKDLNTVFNKSRININTHVSNKEGYLNERLVLILGSGGLLLTDKIKGIDSIIGTDTCVYIQVNIEEQILDILKNYSQYSDIKINGQVKSKLFTWKIWGDILHKYLSHYYFNENYYREFYSIPDNISDVKDYWREFGIDKNHIPYKFIVPREFDYTQYSLDNSITKSKEYLYWHYRIHSRSDRYLLKFDCKRNFDIKKIMNECKVDPSGWFALNECFRAVTKGEKSEDHILRIGEISSNYPGIDISKILRLYFDIVEK